MTSLKDQLNLPNAITIARIVATPFFLWILLADSGEMSALRWAAGVFFIVAIASDAVDGYIARSRGLITDLGKLLDPIADKVLTGAALVGLAILAELPWWVVAVILIREIGITIDRLFRASKVVVAADWMGKLKTVVQSVAIGLAIFPLATVIGDWVVWVNVASMSLAVILTVASGIDYLLALKKPSGAS